jgi:hypothetical protein
VALGAAGTASGHVEVFILRQGLVNPLAVEVVSCQAVHREAVRGLRWLGCSPLLVSFSSERGSGGSGSGGWRNRCAVTDVRTGRRCGGAGWKPARPAWLAVPACCEGVPVGWQHTSCCALDLC